MAGWIFLVLLQQPVPAPAPAPTQADRIRAAMQASIEKQQASVKLQAAASGSISGISSDSVQLTPQTQTEIAVRLLSQVLP